jgi:hypothetical protein
MGRPGMARRRMVLRTIDPLSVLKFGALANLAVAAIGIIAGTVVIRAVVAAGLIEQVCGIAEDIGFLTCDLSPARWTRQLLLLGLVWAVVQTVLLVLLAVLYNLVAGIIGGIAIVMEVEGPAGGRPGGVGAGPTGPAAGGPAGGVPPPVVARPGPAPADAETTTVDAVDAIEAVVPPRASRIAPRGAERGEQGDRGGSGGRLFGGRSGGGA